MLDGNSRVVARSIGDHSPELRSTDFNFFRLGRHVRLVAVCVGLGLFFGISYVSLRPANYAASAVLLIDHKVIQFVRENTMFAASSVAGALLQNQVAVIQSDAIALRVIENLDLAKDKQFQRKPASPVARPANGVPGGSEKVSADPVSAAEGTAEFRGPQESALTVENIEDVLRTFKSNLHVEAGRQDYTVTIKFTSPDPVSAARIVNEISRVYLEEQAEMNKRAAEAASAWLRGRIAELGTSGRVLTEARPPTRRAGPGSVTVLGASGLVGLMLGFAAAFARELTDKRIRTPLEAVAATGVECFGSLPHMKRSPRVERAQEHGKAVTGRRVIEHHRDAFGWALDYPLSRFAHTINRIRIAADTKTSGGRSTRVIGVTSVLPGEGRTTTAANLARVMAKAGKRTLLIDAVPYNAALSRGFFAEGGAGLLGVLRKDVSLAEAICSDERTGMHLLPFPAMAEGDWSVRLLWSQAMEEFLQELQPKYDHVVFDLPPLGPVADVADAAAYLDRFLLVMEWERIDPDVVFRALVSSGSTEDKLLGVVLNKVKVSRWQAFIDREMPAPRVLSHYVRESAPSRNAAHDLSVVGSPWC
ncbi:MAG: AAA family ATPase [Bradyrhizobiaceae bacterium]|nr:AAA family ATPase [Bradyrhizobiaceae bacterium]